LFDKEIMTLILTKMKKYLFYDSQVKEINCKMSYNLIYIENIILHIASIAISLWNFDTIFVKILQKQMEKQKQL
jgi:hypothetical protein